MREKGSGRTRMRYSPLSLSSTTLEKAESLLRKGAVLEKLILCVCV